jgi:hypothetical protein
LGFTSAFTAFEEIDFWTSTSLVDHLGELESILYRDRISIKTGEPERRADKPNLREELFSL